MPPAVINDSLHMAKAPGFCNQLGPEEILFPPEFQSQENALLELWLVRASLQPEEQLKH